MNDFINMMVKRRTIRKFKNEQISENELATIINTGLHAPNAGGRQSAIIVVCQDKELNDELGKINKEIGLSGHKTPILGTISSEQPSILDDENIKSAFYGAPTVLTLFAPKDIYNLTGDCFVAAQNMIIAALSLGIGSCMIARSSETFDTERGKEIQKKWGVGEEYEARIHVVLGYIDGNEPSYKPRKENRIIHA